MNPGKRRFPAMPRLTARRFAWIAAAAATLAFHGAAGAGELGHDAFAAGEYEKALEVWRPMAERGDARAQFNVGLLYDEGLGVDRDEATARRWWTKAADQGLLTASYNLALMEIEQAAAKGPDGDLSGALDQLRQTAEAGYLPARYTLGKVYEYGIGVDKDPARAFENVSIAAQGGFAKAQYSLGKAYRDGDGVDKDAARAAQWFGRAAARGHAGAQDHYARRLYQGEGVEKDPVRAMTFAVLAMRAGVEDARELADEIRGELDIAQLDKAFRAADDFEPEAAGPVATQ